MNKYELFCMIFYVLDSYWDENKDKSVGEYLSGANPFLFTDNCSADPTIFTHFCEVINEKITIENSFSAAKKYILDLNVESISKAFNSISEEEWVESVSNYLSQEHKGQG